jgi:hypothetical protein
MPTPTEIAKKVTSKTHVTKYAVWIGKLFPIGGATSLIRHFSRKSLKEESFIFFKERKTIYWKLQPTTGIYM